MNCGSETDMLALALWRAKMEGGSKGNDWSIYWDVYSCVKHHDWRLAVIGYWETDQCFYQMIYSKLFPWSLAKIPQNKIKHSNIYEIMTHINNCLLRRMQILLLISSLFVKFCHIIFKQPVQNLVDWSDSKKEVLQSQCVEEIHRTLTTTWRLFRSTFKTPLLLLELRNLFLSKQ